MCSILPVEILLRCAPKQGLLSGRNIFRSSCITLLALPSVFLVARSSIFSNAMQLSFISSHYMGIALLSASFVFKTKSKNCTHFFFYVFLGYSISLSLRVLLQSPPGLIRTIYSLRALVCYILLFDKKAIPLLFEKKKDEENIPIAPIKIFPGKAYSLKDKK